MGALLGVLIVSVIAFGTVLYGAFAVGFAASCIWQWYAVPRGLPVISWTECSAAYLMVALYRGKQPEAPEPTRKPDKSEVLGKVLGVLLVPWLVLALAWVLR